MLLPIASAHVESPPVVTVTPSTPFLQSRLLDLDFRSPKATRLPPTVAELEAALAVSSGSVSNYVTFDDAAAPFLDVAASQSHWTTGVGGLIGARAVGWWTGTSMIDGRAVEMREGSTDRFDTMGTTGWDLNGAAGGTIVMVVRFGRWLGTSRRVAFRLNGSSQGWRAVRLGSGSFQFTLVDSVGATATAGSAVIAPSGSRGAWHYVAFQVDRSANQIRIISDAGDGTPVSIAALTTFDPAAVMSIGQGGGLQSVGMQVAAMFRLPGPNATINKALLDAWWRHGKDPTGHVDTYTRTGAVMLPVAETPATGLWVATYDLDQMAFARRQPTLPNGQQASLGLRSMSSLTNQLTDSRLELATLSGGLVRTTQAAESAAGMTDAVQLVAGGTSGDAQTSWSATNATVYSVGCMVWASAPVAGCQLVVATAGGADVATFPITVTTERRFRSATWTATSTATFQLRLRVPAGATVFADMMQVATSSSPEEAWAGTEGGPTGPSGTVTSLSGSDGQYQLGAVGTLRAQYCPDGASVTSGEMIVSTTATANRREISGFSGRVWDSTGSEQGAAVDNEIDPQEPARYVAELEWSAVTAIATGVHSRVRFNNGEYIGAWITGDTNGWTATDAAPTINIGHRGGVSRFEGTIERVEFFSTRQ